MNGNSLYVARQLFSWMKLKRARIESDGNFVSGDLMARPGIAIVQYWARDRSHRIRLQTPSLRQELPRGDGILIQHQASIGIQSGHRMLQRISRKLAARDGNIIFHLLLTSGEVAAVAWMIQSSKVPKL